MLRIVLEAEGWAGRLCAPREMVVERMLKTDEGGLFVVLFSSVEERRARACSRPEAVLAEDSTCEVRQVRSTMGPKENK